MSYRNPKAAPVNTGAAVYEGISKLAGEVYTFANEERERKGKLIAESLAAQQAIDDNVNKMGLNLEEGENNFEKQIFEEAQAAKQKIAAQYEAMSRTFSSPAVRAEAKAEINRLNKYPEALVADLTTGKYLSDQLNKGLMVAPGKTGSISATNDINLLGVIKDMNSGGKNTKIETNAAGARTLVTKDGDQTYKLNISNITNGLKNNPNQMIFHTVVDDSDTTETYLSQLNLGGKNLDLPALASKGILEKVTTQNFAGVDSEIYTVNREKANAAVAGLSESLIKDPSSYNYTNSIWQDKIKGNGTLKEALGGLDKNGNYQNQESVLKQIRSYYVEEAVKQAGVNNNISAKLPKPGKGSYYKTDMQLQTLAEIARGKQLPILGKLYKIIEDEKNVEYIIPQKLDLSKSTPGYVDDEKNKIPLRNKNGKLNYKYFRSLTGDTTKIKN